MVTIVEYHPDWKVTFETLRSTYAQALRSVPIIAIEHVGSTAVEGLAAKAVVDIDIVVAPHHVAEASEQLRSIGFRPLGDQGIAGRWAFRQPADLPRTNTYVTEVGSTALRNHLTVRDALRGDPELRAQYGELKRELASSTTTTDSYVAGKSSFLLGILQRAGLTREELAEIEIANRPG